MDDDVVMMEMMVGIPRRSAEVRVGLRFTLRSQLGAVHYLSGP
jgi:hypothetical protein